MDGKMLARIGAVVFIAIAITATVVEMTRKEDALASPSARPLELERDPLRESQRRCQQLGESAANDPECLRTWAKTRSRFLGHTTAPEATNTTTEAR